MKRPVLLSSDEIDALELLARRIKRARLRRNISQDEMADRIGVARKTYIAMEHGKETVNIGVLVKVLSVLGYTGRLPDLLASDPLGEELEDVHGRQRAGYLEG